MSDSSRIAFAVGTGRCGTKFLSEALSSEPGVQSCHERNPLNETFHRYCKWNGLSVDDSGFLAQKNTEIEADLNRANFSFESSAYLSLSIMELYETFKCKFIFLTRCPTKVINSYLCKGYYDKPLIRYDNLLAPGFQPHMEFHHFLGRIVPNGQEFTTWKKLSRIGKIAWYWSQINSEILTQLNQLPDTQYKIQRLESLDFEAYQNLCSFLGICSQKSKSEFNRLAHSRPNHLGKTPSSSEWNDTEREEFSAQVSIVCEKLNYSDNK